MVRYAPLGMSVVTTPCYNAIKAKSGIDFGSSRIKILRVNHQDAIYVNPTQMKSIHRLMLKVEASLSTLRDMPPSERGSLYKSLINAHIEKYADYATSKSNANFASLCLPVGISDEHPTCNCGKGSAMILLSLIDNQGIKDEY